MYCNKYGCGLIWFAVVRGRSSDQCQPEDVVVRPRLWRNIANHAWVGLWCLSGPPAGLLMKQFSRPLLPSRGFSQRNEEVFLLAASRSPDSMGSLWARPDIARPRVGGLRCGEISRLRHQQLSRPFHGDARASDRDVSHRTARQSIHRTRSSFGHRVRRVRTVLKET